MSITVKNNINLAKQKCHTSNLKSIEKTIMLISKVRNWKILKHWILLTDWQLTKCFRNRNVCRY